MPNLVKLPPIGDDGDVRVVIETPRGSRAKFNYDPELKTFTLAKSLLTGLTYPHACSTARSRPRPVRGGC